MYNIPKDNTIDNIIIGIRLNNKASIFIFNNIPPINSPIGIVIIPHTIPLDKAPIDSFFITPSAKGIVKLRVHPKIDDIKIPENFINSFVLERSIAIL